MLQPSLHYAAQQRYVRKVKNNPDWPGIFISLRCSTNLSSLHRSLPRSLYIALSINPSPVSISLFIAISVSFSISILSLLTHRFEITFNGTPTSSFHHGRGRRASGVGASSPSLLGRNSGRGSIYAPGFHHLHFSLNSLSFAFNLLYFSCVKLNLCLRKL